MKHQRGAALLVILMIVGVLGAFFAMSALTGANADRDKVTATTLTLAQTRDALIGFAVTNRRLPRPATSALNGVEMAACGTEAACTGLIPWATLGISKLDGWGKVIRYSVTPQFATGTIALTFTATKKVRNGAGTLTFQRGTPAPCVTPLATATDTVADCVPAVIFSQGKNNFGTTDAGGTVPNSSVGPTNLDEISDNTGLVAPDPAGVTFIQRTSTENTASPGGEFDDLVIWLSPVTLRVQMQKAGVL